MFVAPHWKCCTHVARSVFLSFCLVSTLISYKATTQKKKNSKQDKWDHVQSVAIIQNVHIETTLLYTVKKDILPRRFVINFFFLARHGEKNCALANIILCLANLFYIPNVVLKRIRSFTLSCKLTQLFGNEAEKMCWNKQKQTVVDIICNFRLRFKKLDVSRKKSISP